MCGSPLHPFLQGLPKCEHHMHLEGALTPQLLFTLAEKSGQSLPTDDPAFTSPETLASRYRNFTSLDDFLHYYYIGMSVLKTSADFEALAWDYFQRAAADGVAHAEVFFDPQAHGGLGVAYETVVAGVGAARRRADRELGITSELICCFLRHLPAPHAVATLALPALRAHLVSGEVRGIGLDSSERDYPPRDFRAVYEAAAALHPGVRLTAHAGEEGPADYIASAIGDLRVSRIDHGIRLVEDGDLLARVARDGTMLTVCPFSNVFLRCVNAVGELPIRTFLDRGVKFSINSDDPAYFGGHYILDNYCAVQEAFELDIGEWKRIATDAIQGSWCSDDRKSVLLEQLLRLVREWEDKRKGPL